MTSGLYCWYNEYSTEFSNASHEKSYALFVRNVVNARPQVEFTKQIRFPPFYKQVHENKMLCTFSTRVEDILRIIQSKSAELPQRNAPCSMNVCNENRT